MKYVGIIVCFFNKQKVRYTGNRETSFNHHNVKLKQTILLIQINYILTKVFNEVVAEMSSRTLYLLSSEINSGKYTNIFIVFQVFF